MTKNFTVFAFLMTGIAAAQNPPAAPPAAAAPVRLATIYVQNAIMSTKDGQKAAQDLQARYTPRKQAIEKKQADLQGMQSQLRSGSATMSQAAKDKLTRDIDTSTKSLQRESEDFQAEVQEAEGKMMNDIGQKLMDVLQKYVSKNGISLVVDVSNQQSPVLWADASIDITNAVVKEYDAAAPAAAAPAPAAATPPPAPATKK